MAGPGLADPASPILLLKSPSGRSAVPRTVLRLRFSIDPSDFDAGSTALSCRLSVLDSLGLDSSKPIVFHCLII
ncbi:unnamed protein product [Brassica oleracea var. botrytis]|uniref:Uncharacterized protein n=1 Tax=Brassica oleracea TaxID=3712 RepID=A0A3P6E5I5_BRAOL|nr:unnamed protein product [Brassica oleracea]